MRKSEVEKVLRRTQSRKVAKFGIEKTASDTLENEGTLIQFLGHLFEIMDTQDYNRTNADRNRKIVPHSKHVNPGTDAIRLRDGKFAGAIQQTISSDPRNNHRKLDGKTTVRIPKGTVPKKHRKPTRIEESNISRKQLEKRAKTGLTKLARKGESNECA